MSERSEKNVEVDRVVSWRDCNHKFKFYFGPIMHCKCCGATTTASVDGTSKPIYAPLNLDELEAS